MPDGTLSKTTRDGKVSVLRDLTNKATRDMLVKILMVKIFMAVYTHQLLPKII